MTGFPDVELALCALLADLGSTGTLTPPDLQDRLPFLRIIRFGGGDDRISDRARVDVDVFAPTRASGWPLAEQVRQRLTAGPHAVAGAVLDSATTSTGPTEVPWDGTGIRRWTASYEITTRRP